MIIDNFELIKNLLTLSNKDEFYMLQIMQRSKDGGSQFVNHGKNNATRTIKTYFISSVEYLESKEEEIKALCEMFNARAYINLNKKSYRQVSLKMIKELADILSTEDSHRVKSLFESACGQSGACDKNKTWIVDADTKDENELEEIKRVIGLCEPFDREKIVAEVPTLHGVHLITRPFRKDKFRDLYKNAIDIHDNNPTLLYYKEVEV